jgi:hypothetical protein
MGYIASYIRSNVTMIDVHMGMDSHIDVLGYISAIAIHPDPNVYIQVLRGIHKSDTFSPSIDPDLFWFNIIIHDPAIITSKQIHVYAAFFDPSNELVRLDRTIHGLPIIPDTVLGTWSFMAVYNHRGEYLTFDDM